MQIGPPQSPVLPEGVNPATGGLTPSDGVKQLAHHLARLALLHAHSSLGGGLSAAMPSGPQNPLGNELATAQAQSNTVPNLPGQITAPMLRSLGLGQQADALWAARHPNNAALAARRQAAAQAAASGPGQPVGY